MQPDPDARLAYPDREPTAMRLDFLHPHRGGLLRLLFVAWALWLAAAGCSAASSHARHAPAQAPAPAEPSLDRPAPLNPPT